MTASRWSLTFKRARVFHSFVVAGQCCLRICMPVLSSANAYRSLGRALRLTRVAAAPDVVPPQDDASQDGLGGDGCRDRFLHAELKLLAENPPLRARAPREPCTGPIEAHGKQFFIATLEEVGSLAIICISHGCLLASTRHQHRLIPGGQLLRACTVDSGEAVQDQ